MTVSSHPVISPRKLIEVALPLDAINEASAHEKQPGIGAHPRGLHLWWARRPLAAARAVIFGQLVHDPEDLWRCQNPGKEPGTGDNTRMAKVLAVRFAQSTNADKSDDNKSLFSDYESNSNKKGCKGSGKNSDNPVLKRPKTD